MTPPQKSFDDVPDHGGIDGYRPEFVDVEGVRTRYYDVGEGDPLVLLHGGNWRGHASANKWTATFDRLSDRFRVLAPDRIGCGLTENPPTPHGFRYESELEHALGFLDALGIESFHLGGYSRGAGLAARVAVDIPERVRSLTVTNTATLGPPIGDERYRHDRVFRWLDRDFDRTDPEFIRERLTQYSYRTAYITDERCRVAAAMESRPKARETAEMMDERGYLKTWQRTLAEQMELTRERITEGVLDMPILYVYGRNDLTVPFEMAIHAFDLLGRTNDRVRLTAMNECGHMIFLEHPEEFARTVIDFVEYWSDDS